MLPLLCCSNAIMPQTTVVIGRKINTHKKQTKNSMPSLITYLKMTCMVRDAHYQKNNKFISCMVRSFNINNPQRAGMTKQLDSNTPMLLKIRLRRQNRYRMPPFSNKEIRNLRISSCCSKMSNAASLVTRFSIILVIRKPNPKGQGSTHTKDDQQIITCCSREHGVQNACTTREHRMHRSVKATSAADEPRPPTST